ncbi:hypothetical protein PGTUg99_016534 [Puccinia graminis f. sp. tritici]|uniref:Glycoside hydrolase family 71 protein n=2 Tax=Puccinia graminis f. sp. tritici TaxID=56615 RepID=A0A5B0RY70_PUCGR|nr:hypothetical protein PGTUg99_016534 [Puccinia graminis f. sp. tritici]
MGIVLTFTIMGTRQSRGKGSVAEGSQAINADEVIIRVIPDPRDSHPPGPQHHPEPAIPNERPRYVFAHVVQGNFQFYQAEDWASDMRLAQRMGIDAFAINIGRDVTNEKQLPLIYEIAEMNSFQVFLSFDMVYYGQAGSSNDVIRLIETFAPRKAQFMYQGKPLVSTFSGEVPGNYLDNNPDYNSAWGSLKAKLHFPIYFMPCWTGIDPKTVSSIDGMLSWDAWSPVSSSQDRRYKDNLAALGKQYAAPLSAMFYKHLSAQRYGNYLYPTESWFVVEKFIALISLNPDFIEILSWNDYGESHYLRDPRPSANLPMDTTSSEKYVNHMPHEPLLDLISYFNEWYKSGSRPLIKRSRAYVWYRTHPRDAVSKSDLLPAPNGASVTEDKMYIVILVSPATKLQYISIESGDKYYYTDLEEHETFKRKDAILLISVPFRVGDNQTITLYDPDETALGCLVGRGITAEPEIYNFNYWSGFIEF